MRNVTRTSRARYEGAAGHRNHSGQRSGDIATDHRTWPGWPRVHIMPRHRVSEPVFTITNHPGGALARFISGIYGTKRQFGIITFKFQEDSMRAASLFPDINTQINRQSRKNKKSFKMVATLMITFRPPTGQEPWHLPSLCDRKNILIS